MDTSPVTASTPPRIPRSFGEPVLLLFAALLLLWPAWLNRGVFLMPDAIAYVRQGHEVIRGMVHPALYPVGIDARSEFYTALMYLAHWDRTLWPVVFLNGLYVVFVLRLTLRFFFGNRMTTAWFLLVVLVLSAFTGLSWYVCVPMADVYGGLVYLGLFLLAVRRDVLSRGERIVLSVLSAWGIAAHSSHLLVACAVVATLAGLMRASRFRDVLRWKGIGQAVLVILCSVFAQMLFHAELYGQFVLNPHEPPQLLDRLQDDGPAVAYLRANCSHLDWVICRRAAELPQGFDAFLFAPKGFWQSTPPGERKKVLREQFPLLLGTMRAYPRWQAKVTAHQFHEELMDMDLGDFVGHPFVEANLNWSGQGAELNYPKTRQAQRSLPLAQISLIDDRFLVLSDMVCILLLGAAWYRRRNEAVAFAIMVCVVLLVNALVCTVFAIVDARYETRVLWLIPLAAVALWPNVSSRDAPMARDRTAKS